jgi:PleD family two-component response regulator
MLRNRAEYSARDGERFANNGIHSRVVESIAGAPARGKGHGFLKRAYRVLACTSPEAERRLRKALRDDELVMALTFSEAASNLVHHKFDVVLVGMMFDESRALELTQMILSNDSIPKVPIVGIRGAKIARIVDPNVFDVPMAELGAVDVIDFASIPDDDAGNARLGARIRACIKSSVER